MRVLLISNMYPSTGKPYAGVFVKNQYEYLSATDTENSYQIFFMRRQFTSALGSVRKYLLVTLRFIPYLGRRYDVVHVHYFYPLLALAWIYKALHRRARIVVTFHGGDVLEKLRNERVRRMFARAARSIDYAIAVGTDVAHAAAELLRIQVHEVLPAGVDRRVFHVMRDIGKEYDFLFVGSFVERKGIDLLLAAVVLLDRPVRLCFVGSGPMRAAIESCAVGRPIEVLGTRTQAELCELYNKTRFFILPSRSEPFGLVVTEALYCGTPVIVSGAGGLREQVVDGMNGLILEQNTPVAIAAAMRRCASMSAEEYERLARAAAASNDNYSLQAVCHRLVAIYAGLRP